jgi:hypothetical protein
MKSFCVYIAVFVGILTYLPANATEVCGIYHPPQPGVRENAPPFPSSISLSLPRTSFFPVGNGYMIPLNEEVEAVLHSMKPKQNICIKGTAMYDIGQATWNWFVYSAEEEKP